MEVYVCEYINFMVLRLHVYMCIYACKCRWLFCHLHRRPISWRIPSSDIIPLITIHDTMCTHVYVRVYMCWQKTISSSPRHEGVPFFSGQNPTYSIPTCGMRCFYWDLWYTDRHVHSCMHVHAYEQSVSIGVFVPCISIIKVPLRGWD